MSVKFISSFTAYQNNPLAERYNRIISIKEDFDLKLKSDNLYSLKISIISSTNKKVNIDDTEITTTPKNITTVKGQQSITFKVTSSEQTNDDSTILILIVFIDEHPVIPLQQGDNKFSGNERYFYLSFPIKENNTHFYTKLYSDTKLTYYFLIYEKNEIDNKPLTMKTNRDVWCIETIDY